MVLTCDVVERYSMAIDLSQMAAAQTLRHSRERCLAASVDTCEIKDVIDFALSAKLSLTYRYILATALTAKATDDRIDILSLQASDNSAGAYDARSLCSHVVFPFQRDFLGDILDGANNDPLVNKPGRFPRLSNSNAAQNGDPKKLLALLCENLPKVDTKEKAERCLDYLVSRLLELKETQDRQQELFDAVTASATSTEARMFVDELLDQGFGGAALVMVAAALYGVLFPKSDGYEIRAHPANQAGTSSRQASDLDVLTDGSFWLATELKDKVFTQADVSHAVDTAARAGVQRVLFIAGRQSTIDGQTAAYFADNRREWMSRGVYVGVMPIDALVDFVFATRNVDPSSFFASIQEAADTVRSIEASMWVYGRIEELKKES